MYVIAICLIEFQMYFVVVIGCLFVHQWTSIGVSGGLNDVRWMSKRILSRMSRRDGHFEYTSRTKKREVFLYFWCPLRRSIVQLVIRCGIHFGQQNDVAMFRGILLSAMIISLSIRCPMVLLTSISCPFGCSPLGDIHWTKILCPMSILDIIM